MLVRQPLIGIVSAGSLGPFLYYSTMEKIAHDQNGTHVPGCDRFWLNTFSCTSDAVAQKLASHLIEGCRQLSKSKKKTCFYLVWNRTKVLFA